MCVCVCLRDRDKLMNGLRYFKRRAPTSRAVEPSPVWFLQNNDNSEKSRPEPGTPPFCLPDLRVKLHLGEPLMPRLWSPIFYVKSADFLSTCRKHRGATQFSRYKLSHSSYKFFTIFGSGNALAGLKN